ncbi:hypothetical protein Calab_1509 [Caldithrix abyssi DSM 13497]|uniref:Uncharacterized protein n=1 Tax=Caldithrix abyssi DSM 13497 TaxID=880073 RepID=H1XTF6_CALAY|nr:hypothetical protein [Caldithrix abyssi]APF16973.1 hypothetical protein Cabys_222 [Caldithrix abyssi DSM 13497]APF20338.1 hypothetical protein Cabys_3592 [Caldithrix abyssi DSM 13497]EHO40389.1 hypothetical protein Calab_0750 [Caldithrix abyssi DSM 13497]EHO41129.1 hypothetical protein Calab_1509 [Caldithrix abyssi DSM 13497]
MVELIGFISQMIDIISKGIELKDRKKEKSPVFHFKVNGFSLDKKCLLLEVSVSNNSEMPFTIVGFKLILGDLEIDNLPIENVKIITSAGDVIQVNAPFNLFIMERKKIKSLKILPSNLYLLQNQTDSGLILFELPPKIDITQNAKLKLLIGGYDFDISANIL